MSSKKFGVLFVCLGNICRSPTAEAIFYAKVEKEGRVQDFDIDSCGTGGGSPNWYESKGFSYHEGDSADPRMSKAAAKRGYKLNSKSRPLKPDDFDRFDLILGMDSSNITAILTAAKHWKIPKQKWDKVKLFPEYAQQGKNAGTKAIPDPYYGGSSGFETVLDLVEDIAEQLWDHLENDSKLKLKSKD